MSSASSVVPHRFRGPHIGVLATVSVCLFIAGLIPVTIFGGMPYFPGPVQPVSDMVAFFSQRQAGVLLCAFFQFGSAIPLGLFAVAISSQLTFLGVRAAGTSIAWFGGVVTAINIIFSACILWTMTYAGIPQDVPLLHALYRVSFGLGGPGFSVPFALMAAGVSVTAGIYRLLPKWIVVLGFVVAVFGVLSWFEILTVRALPLIPLNRFPGFVWMIAAGFALPRTTSRKELS